MDEKELHLQDEVNRVFRSMMGSLIFNKGKPYDENTIKEHFKDFEKAALIEFIDHQDGERLLKRINMIKLEFLKRLIEETKILDSFFVEENSIQVDAFIKDLNEKWKKEISIAKELGGE